MGRKRTGALKGRQSTRIVRPPTEGGKRRGVKPGTRRGPYDTSKTADPLSPKAGTRPPAFSELSLMPKDLLDRAVWKSHLVADYVIQGRGMLEPLAKLAAKRHGIAKREIPGYSVLHAWARQYREYGVLYKPQEDSTCRELA